MFKTILSFHQNYGKNIAFWKLFNSYGVSITDVKDLETIFSFKLTEKSIEYSYTEPWIGMSSINFPIFTFINKIF